MTFIPLTSPFSSIYNTVAVFVDCPAGVLSFYTMCSNTPVNLNTFSATFTEPLYAGFKLLPHSLVCLRLVLEAAKLSAFSYALSWKTTAATY